METQEYQIRNLQFCMAKLRDFVNAVPKGAGENVHWGELNQHRDLAEMSLAQLAAILGGSSDSDCDRIGSDCIVYPKM